MTDKVFIISDTHFGHEKCYTAFKKKDGSPLRPHGSAEAGDAAMVENWNRVVSDGDLVLHLGDVAFDGTIYDRVMPLLKGRKYLIRGNHDRFSEGRYRKHFNRVLGCYVRDNYAFTHVPIHPESGSRWQANIHGHLHANNLINTHGQTYFNCSVEQIDFTPIEFEEIKRRLSDK